MNQMPKEKTHVALIRFYGKSMKFIAALGITFNLLIQGFNIVTILFYASAFFAGCYMIQTAHED